MKINNWKKFNELKDSTYKSAAKKFKELGHERTAKRLEEHPKFLDKLEIDKTHKKLLDKYKHVAPFQFNNTIDINKNADGKFIIKGEFYNIDFVYAYDLWREGNDKEVFSIPCNFKLLLGLINDYDGFFIKPFWITKELYDDNKLVIEGPFDIEDSPWEIEGTNPILFSNRKDAIRFINLLKNDPTIQKELNEINDEEFIELYHKTVNELNPKHLYR